MQSLTQILKLAQSADPDRALLQAVAGQDGEALNALYQKYAAELLAYLSSRLGDRRLAEDVLQEVMLAVWRSAARFRGECRVRTWLLAIARHHAINAYQRQLAPRAREVALDEYEDGFEAEAPGAYSDLRAAMLRLPPEQRETLELVFDHGLSLEETALVLNTPSGTVKSRLHRAKAQLRQWLKAE